MGVGQGVLMVLRDRLVEVLVLLLGDVRLLSQPDGLNLIDGLPLPDLLGYCLGLRLLGGLIFSGLGFTLILDLSIVLLSFLCGLINRLLVFIGDLLADLLREEELDGVLNELGVFLDEVLDLVLLDILDGVVFQVQGHTGAAAQGVPTGVLCHKELGIGCGGPHVLLVVVGLGGHNNLVGYQEG